MTDDLRDLIDQHLDGTLDAAGHAEFERRLSVDEAARREFALYCQMHADLHLDAKASSAADRAMASVPRPRRIPSSWIAVAASVIVIGVGASLWLNRGEKPVEPVAYLVNAQDCQWTDGRPPEGGFKPGSTLAIDGGLAEIRFRKGARLVVSGPARLELLGDNQARLHRGRIAANVPEEAIGFELLSPKGKVIDLGTEFGVAVAEDGTTDVAVFKGVVESESPGQPKVRLEQNMAMRVGGATVGVLAKDNGFVRSIVPTPVVEPRTRTFDFKAAVAGSLLDRDGVGVGMTKRLPGTGGAFVERDANLKLTADRGLEVTTTRSDINHQLGMPTGEYFGVPLADLGFTGSEDFEIAADFPHIPALRRVGQFGVFAGTKSDKVVRGGLISRDGGEYRQNIVNNDGGLDTDSVFVGLSSTGDDMRVILKRTAGHWSLAVENRTRGQTVTLETRPPTFLNDDPSLMVGVFAANTQSDESKTLAVRQIRVTVWKVR